MTAGAGRARTAQVIAGTILGIAAMAINASMYRSIGEGPYTMCGDSPRCSTGIVNVPADGLNVRVVPNGPPVMSLVNGTPLIPLQKQGDWLLVAPSCDLTPTWAWSWNAGVPLNRCWVYF